MNVQVNPVVGRELKERMRGMKSFIILSLFVLVLVLTTFIVYEGTARNVEAWNLAERTLVGRRVFETVTLVMVGLVLFFVPALTAGAVAGERERQTLLPLQVTLMRPRQILAGKVTAALAYLVLLIVASIPVMAVAYALGGLRVIDIVRAIVAVVALAVVLAAMVIAISTFVRRSQTATLLSYAFTVLITIAGPLAFAVLLLVGGRGDGGNDGGAPSALLAANPIVGVADFASGSFNSDAGPLSAIRTGVYESKWEHGNSWWSPDRQGDAWLEGGDGRMVLMGDEGAIAVAAPAGTIAPDIVVDGVEVVEEAAALPAPIDEGLADSDPASGLRAWMIAVLSLGGLSLVMFALAARRLRAPADEER